MATEAALAAKAIKSELKIAFPQIKFSVKSENFAGGDAVRIHYTDGVPTKVVEKITNKYQSGSFDGMTDMYEYTNSREDIPQAKYVQVYRDVSPEAKAKVKQDIATKFGIQNPGDEQEWQKVFRCWSDQVVWRELENMTF